VGGCEGAAAHSFRLETRRCVDEAPGVVRVGMLLCLSSRCWWVFEESVEVPGEVALEATRRLPAALSFAHSAFDVVDGRLVDSASGEDDLMQGAVELSVATAVESVADGLAGGG